MPGMPTIDDTPLAQSAATPAEVQERLVLETRGHPFLLFRGADGRQRLFALHPGLRRVTIGRGPGNDVALGWDTEASRVHAELERLGDAWTLVDDGSARHGTALNGERVDGRQHLRDGDVLTVGRTLLALRIPSRPKGRRKAAAAAPAAPRLSPTQRRVLEALCRPYTESEFAVPASNQAIGEELFLSSDAVKAHLRALVTVFGLDALPSAQQRTALALRARQLGIVSA
jgi:pSer/pThr/pTyr-binding forkhead associated (FHA) protein